MCSENTVYETVMVGTCQCTFVQTHTMLSTQRELLCEVWTAGDGDASVQFTDCQKHTPLVRISILGEAVRGRGQKLMGTLGTFCLVLL